ncbi:MAG: glycosyltransferase, partial [Candidatus Heimdallarchaeota archaeon]|nr:glycosyltransferase [Candidatus Heimdallarchaeota archaeon]
MYKKISKGVCPKRIIMQGIPKIQKVKEHFDNLAKDYDKWKKKNSYYYRNIRAFVKSNVSPGKSVLEVGCGTGELLAATNPHRGVGIDISSEMIKIADRRHPQFKFINAAIEDFTSQEKFDYIILVDILDHVFDVMDVLKSVYRLSHPSTKIILTTINPWWEPVFSIAEKFKAKVPEGPHNFIEKRNITKMMELVDLSSSYSGYLLLIPKYVPVFSFLANTIGVRMWGLNKLAVVPYMILQPTPENTTDLGFGCSVIIPCHNEEGNICEAIKRIPKMGKATEIIVVNDGSTDGTAQKVRELEAEYPNLKLIDYSPNRGKGHAVIAGFAAATQEVLMILDA